MLKVTKQIQMMEQAFFNKLCADTIIVESVAPYVFDDDIDRAESACAVIDHIKVINNTIRFYMYSHPN